MAQNSEQRVEEIIVNGQKANASMKEMAAAAAVLNNQVAKLAADDPKRAELIAQLQEMRQRLAATRRRRRQRCQQGGRHDGRPPEQQARIDAAGAQIGKINVTDFHTYVAVERSIARQAVSQLSAGKVKGKKVKVRFLNEL